MKREDEFRRRALIAAARLQGPRAGALLGLHPDGSRLLPDLDAPPVRLEELPWEELTALETEVGVEELVPETATPDPLHYVHRRLQAQAKERWLVHARRLPRRWLALAALDAPGARAACLRLGQRVVCVAALAREGGPTLEWLRPLGRARAQAVVEEWKLERGEAVPADLGRAALAAYDRAAAERTGERVVSQLGRRVLRSALDTLGKVERDALSRAMRSNLLALLERDAPLVPGSTTEVAALDAWIERAVLHGGAR